MDLFLFMLKMWCGILGVIISAATLIGIIYLFYNYVIQKIFETAKSRADKTN